VLLLGAFACSAQPPSPCGRGVACGSVGVPGEVGGCFALQVDVRAGEVLPCVDLLGGRAVVRVARVTYCQPAYVGE
jgi:hypothetical protein